MNEAQEQVMPAPVLLQRDSDGRLVGVVIDGGHPLLSTEGNAWVAAIDGSAYSLRATTKLAHMLGLMRVGGVHLINVQPWLSTEAAERELLRRGWEATALERKLLDDSAIPWRLHVLMGEAAEHIVTLANSLGCDGIVMGSKGMGATQAMLLGSVAYKVMHQSSVPVLLVR